MTTPYECVFKLDDISRTRIAPMRIPLFTPRELPIIEEYIRKFEEYARHIPHWDWVNAIRVMKEYIKNEMKASHFHWFEYVIVEMSLELHEVAWQFHCKKTPYYDQLLRCSTRCIMWSMDRNEISMLWTLQFAISAMTGGMILEQNEATLRQAIDNRDELLAQFPKWAVPYQELIDIIFVYMMSVPRPFAYREWMETPAAIDINARLLSLTERLTQYE
jgi:hypothetical protein